MLYAIELYGEPRLMASGKWEVAMRTIDRKRDTTKTKTWILHVYLDGTLADDFTGAYTERFNDNNMIITQKYRTIKKTSPLAKKLLKFALKELEL